jgi:hypothetical protein
MLIDADVHISPTPQGGNSIEIEELLRRMDRCGVDKAVTWLQPPYVRSDIEAGNAYVARAMRDHPDRVLGFGWADPNLGVGEAIAAVRRAVEEYGFYGVKLNGAQNSFRIDDPALALPVIEAVRRSRRRVGAPRRRRRLRPDSTRRGWRRSPAASRSCGSWSSIWAAPPSTT